VTSCGQVVEELLAALQARDEAAITALLHPDVVAAGNRGRKRGPAEVVAWAKPSVDGHLVSSVEVDDMRTLHNEWIAVAARRLWTWAESREVADEEPFGVLFRVEDGLVIHWDQTFGSMTDAIDGIPAA